MHWGNLSKVISILKVILKGFFSLLPKKIIIFLINNNYFILKSFGYKDLYKRLNKNGLKVIDIRYIKISKLFILRNVVCELIKSTNCSLIPFIESYKLKNGDLSISKSFHYKLFKNLNKIDVIENDMKSYDYYYWHKSLHQMGINHRSDTWIANKFKSCQRLLNSIKKKKFNKFDLLNYPIILDIPLINSRYKIKYDINGYEIFDGHHRVSCAKSLGYYEIPCIICKDIALFTPFGIEINEILKN